MAQPILLGVVTALAVELLEAELDRLPWESRGAIRASLRALRQYAEWLADEAETSRKAA